MDKPETDRISEVRDMLGRIVASRPRISIEGIDEDGDVIFAVSLKGMGLTKEDLVKKTMRARFFINTVGELLVRDHIDEFVPILTGLEPTLFDKIICASQHTDFGMIFDRDNGIVKLQMHISLVQQIITEDFDRLADGSLDDPSEPNWETTGPPQDPAGD